MKINELIIESQINEYEWTNKLGTAVGNAAGTAAKGVGAVAGGLRGAWDAMKKGYDAGKEVVGQAGDPATTPATTPAGGTAPATTTPAQGAGQVVGGEVASNNLLARAQQGTTQDPAATAGDPALDGIMQQVQGLDANQKNELLTKLQGGDSEPAAPGGQSVEIDPAKAAADKAAKNQADADLRNAEIEKTKQANAQTAQADAELVAAVKAAKAKPAFQQDASDKLTIKQGAAKGIHESKKKKKLAEFNSKFLRMVI